MKNVWRVIKRDAHRIVSVPVAWIIIAGVLVTPALYAWFNIAAFWDPYGNTGNISVAVANLDQGGSSDLTGELNAGDLIVDKLEDNDELGWYFTSEAQAREDVDSGDAYAAFVIPADFTANMLSITTGDYTQPAIDYYVNEKSSAIAPKITDTGASQLETQITEEFTAEVTKGRNRGHHAGSR